MIVTLAVRTHQQQPALAAGCITGNPRASGSLVFTALTIAPCIPSATSCVNSTDIWSNPAASSPASYSPLDSAPAMHPAKLPRSARSVRSELVVGDNVADPDPPARLRSTRAISVSTFALSTERLITQFEITTSIESAGKRNLLDYAPEQMHIRGAGLDKVAPGEREHLIDHVQAIDHPIDADPLRGKDQIDPATRPQIEHGLTLTQFRHRRRIATTKRRKHRSFRQPTRLLSLIQRLAKHFSDLAVIDAARATATTTPLAVLADRESRVRIATADLLAKLVGTHTHLATSFFVVPARAGPTLASRRAALLVAPGLGVGRLSVLALPITSSAAEGKHAMQRSLIRNKLLAPRCSTSTKHVSASRRRCSDTVDCPTSTAATISPTDNARRSPASKIQNLQPRRIRQTTKPTRKQLRLITSNHRPSTITD